MRITVQQLSCSLLNFVSLAVQRAPSIGSAQQVDAPHPTTSSLLLGSSAREQSRHAAAAQWYYRQPALAHESISDCALLSQSETPREAVSPTPVDVPLALEAALFL